MTTVEFQPETGHLRLDRETFDQIARWYAGPPGPERGAAAPAPLSAAGAVDPGGELAAPIELALRAVVGAICRLTIEIRRPGEPTAAVEQGSGWVNGDAATLLLPLPDGRYELGMVHPSFLPAMLLRVLQVGPRPRLGASGPLSVDPAQLDQLTSGNRDWRVRATWRPARDSAGVRAIRVLDTADGLWLVESDQRGAVLFPTTATAVFRALVGLLPADHELAPPA